MTSEEKYKYWKMLSDYDIETVRALIDSERWVYVATISQSAIERLLKGLIVLYSGHEAPKSHNVVFLMNKLGDNERFSVIDAGARFNCEKYEYMDMIIDIMYYHISDYPFSYQNVMDRFIDAELARKIFDETTILIEWLSGFAGQE